MDSLLTLIGRERPLFEKDLERHGVQIERLVRDSSFLVIGGAGSIGRAVSKEIFLRSPARLHVVDISENNLVELVRDLRSSTGYGGGEFRTFAIDAGSREFDALIANEGPYDYVLNLSAMKHVRSERDPYTLMRLIDTNIFNTEKSLHHAIRQGSKKYFCVSTDKATNPVNVMGASKRIMELFLGHYSRRIPVSTARFANVAFSDGSLLHGFEQRIRKRQPLSAPNDIRRYFITPELHLTGFDEIARRYLASLGYEAHPCETEEEARSTVAELSRRGKWPCYFSASTTSGEKDIEEFFTPADEPDFGRFHSLGVLALPEESDPRRLDWFRREVARVRRQSRWQRDEIIRLFTLVCPLPPIRQRRGSS